MVAHTPQNPRRRHHTFVHVVLYRLDVGRTRVLHELHNESYLFGCLAISHGGGRVAAGSRNEVSVWRTSDCEPEAVVLRPTPVVATDFSPCDEQVLVQSQGSPLMAFCASTGAPTVMFGPAVCSRFMVVRQQIVTVHSGSRLMVWDSAGALRRRGATFVSGDTLQSEGEFISMVVDGGRAAFVVRDAGPSPYKIVAWDVLEGRTTAVLKGFSRLVGVHFCRNGDRLVTVEANMAATWTFKDAGSAEPTGVIRIATEDRARPRRCAVSRDGRALAVAFPAGRIQLYKMK